MGYVTNPTAPPQDWDLGGDLQAVADIIEQAGVRAGIDPTRLDLPGAWVCPGPLEFTLDTSAEMTAEVYLISQDKASPAALTDIGNMALALRKAGLIAAGEFVQLTLANYGDLPAFKTTIPLHITKG